jgi:hypothetical protein
VVAVELDRIQRREFPAELDDALPGAGEGTCGDLASHSRATPSPPERTRIRLVRTSADRVDVYECADRIRSWRI